MMTPLNAAQMKFLQLLWRIKTEEELSELRKVVCDYYARKIKKEIYQLCAEGKMGQRKLSTSRTTLTGIEIRMQLLPFTKPWG